MRFGSGLARVAQAGQPALEELFDLVDLTEPGDGAAAEVQEVPAAADLTAAALLAAEAALAGLGGETPDLACVFICGRTGPEIVAAGAAACDLLNAVSLIGCSAHGVIGPGAGVELEPAVSVWVASLPGARIRAFHLSVLRAPDGLTVVGMPDLETDDAVGVLLADPWTFPVDGFVELSNEILPGLPLVGGLATGATGPRFGSAAPATWLCADGLSHESGAVGVLIGGDVDVAAVVSQGCRPVGPTMIVTKSEGNELLELAGATATDKLQDIVRGLVPDDRELAMTGLQIGIAMDEYAEEHERGDFLIRGVGGLHPERGSIVVGDVVDVGRTVRFQVRDADAAHDELGAVLAKFRADSGAPAGALLFSCNGRGRSMFPTPHHDVLMVRSGLGVDAVAGFFAAGEIGPVGGKNHLHGFTASILAFGARGLAHTPAGSDG